MSEVECPKCDGEGAMNHSGIGFLRCGLCRGDGNVSLDRYRRYKNNPDFHLSET